MTQEEYLAKLLRACREPRSIAEIQGELRASGLPNIGGDSLRRDVAALVEREELAKLIPARVGHRGNVAVRYVAASACGTGTYPGGARTFGPGDVAKGV